MPGLVGDFFFPDTCQIHKHQRTKLSIRSLKRHTMAAYSGANLDRLFSVRSEKLKTLDIDVTHRTVRRIGPRPSTAAGTHGVTLHELIENMYAGMIAEKRKNGRQSQLLLDCFELAAFANDYLDSEDALAGVIIHWCWDCATNTPCCKSEEETCCNHGIPCRVCKLWCQLQSRRLERSSDRASDRTSDQPSDRASD